MAIEFAALEGVDIAGQAELALRARLTGIGVDMAATDAAGILIARLAAHGEAEESDAPVVVLPNAGSAALTPSVAGVLSVDITMSAELGLALAPSAYGQQNAAAGDTPGFASVEARAIVRGLEEPVATGYAILIRDPAIVTVLGGVSYERITEVLDIAWDGSTLPIYGIADRVLASVDPITTFQGIASASSGIEFGDSLAVVMRELVLAGFDLTAAQADQYTAINQVMDALLLSGLAASTLDARNTVVAAIALQVLTDLKMRAEITDTLAVGAAVGDILTAVAQLVDGLLVGLQDNTAATFGAVVPDGFVLSAGPASVLEAHNLLQDGVAFSLRLSLSTGEYLAYVVNTENKQHSSYTNYPFNSFAALPGPTYYGMTPDGIRRIGGQTDDGADIASRFRLAFTNMGTSAYKRMQSAYLGYTSTGDLRVKVIVRDPNSGERQAHYYRMLRNVGDEPQSSRVKIGQGLKTVYWGFEVEAIDGAQFHIDLLELYPLVLEQHMHGQGGGKR